MDPDRWERLNALFHQALERDPADRDAFLGEACAGDPALAAEVQGLVAAHAGASVFDRPAYEADPDLPRDDGRTLVGHRLGPYQITSLLGRGGMGVVYLGEDTRLQRPVAIKALPAAFTHDAQFRARLKREAMTTAALSHPGIATVFALEEFDGHLYLVREYVAGRTLRAEIGEGPLPLATVRSMAVDVARALAAAHARGVIHRDLKPENVLRTTDAGIKVVDFGLARFERGDAAVEERLTRAGGVLGTPGYMSPEALRGDTVDARADQFSFGVLLYELVTGAHPFDAGDEVATIARILESEPAPVTTLRPDCAADIVRIIARCLAKQPIDRYERTDALAADLAAGTDSRPTTPARPMPSAPAPGRPFAIATPAPRWWWQFHQVAISALYIGMLYPMWYVRGWMSASWGLAAFVAAVAVAGVSANLRVHLWFTSYVYPSELADQRQRVSRWKGWADALFALLLLVTATAIAGAHAEMAALFVGVAVTSVIGALLVEPATTRAAFPLRGQSP